MSHRLEAVYWRHVGHLLYVAREARHLTLESVARAMHCSVGLILESELVGPSEWVLAALCHLYGLRVTDVAPTPGWKRPPEDDPNPDLRIVDDHPDGPLPF